MNKSETMRLRLLELADKRTPEYESVLYLIANAKCLLKFVNNEKEELIQTSISESEQIDEVLDEVLDESDNVDEKLVNEEIKSDQELKLKSSPDLGDSYVADFISKQNNEQVPFELEQNIKKSIQELNDVQLENIDITLRKIMTEELDYREKMREADNIVIDKTKSNECEKQSKKETETLPFKDNVVFSEEVGKALFGNLLPISESTPVENSDPQNISTENVCISGHFAHNIKPFFYFDIDSVNEYADEREED